MAYAQRYAGGFVNGDNSRQVDAPFLNAVEDALLKLFGVAPATNGALIWDGTKFTAASLLKNAQIDAAAAIDKSKLAALAITDADVAGGAAIARSKLNFGAGLVQADMAAGNKITTSTIAGGPPGGPADKDIWIATAVDANGTRWAFQYNAGSASAYKWEFIGGSSLSSFSPSGVNSPTVGYSDDAATRITLPRNGDYKIFGSTSVYHAALGRVTVVAIRDGAGVFVNIGWFAANPSDSDVRGGVSGEITQTGAVSGQYVNVGGQINAGVEQIIFRTVRVTPVRIS